MVSRYLYISFLANETKICNINFYTFQEGVYDADVHIDILDSSLAEGGRNCFVLCDASLPPLKMGKLNTFSTYSSILLYVPQLLGHGSPLAMRKSWAYFTNTAKCEVAGFSKRLRDPINLNMHQNFTRSGT